VDLQGVPYATLQDELSRDPAVREMAADWEPPASNSNNGSSVARPGKDTLVFTIYSVDAHFLDVLDLRLVAGRNFADESPRDQVILNETAAQRLGFASPVEAIGQEVYFGSSDGHVSITGVVEDYYFKTASKNIEPMLLYQDPDTYRRLMIRVVPGQMPQALARLEETWKRIDPVHPAEYVIYDAQLRRDNEVIRIFNDLRQIVAFATLIALVLSCLGLLAMAAFTARLRTKEVGIRKVLGATIAGVVWLLSREFLALIPLAAAIALPVAWFGNNLWLEQIAHVPFGPGILLSGIAFLAVLALLAVGYQAIRTALADPVRSLRYE
jgi:putative ABC transport system permease protein